MILIVGALTAFGPLCIDMYLPALPIIGRDLHASASVVQISITACLVGMALGQLSIGPISDQLGRRRPLFIGLFTFVAASLVLTLAPNIYVLIALRFVQGFGGAAGLVISQAIVRDRYSGTAAARFFSLILMVTGAGPILAPQLGAGILHLGSWRVIFIALAALGSALIVTALLWLPETLAKENRSTGTLGATVRTMRGVATDRNFLASALSCGFAFGAAFAYIAGSSFALENVYGLSPEMFSLIYTINAVGLIGASQVNGHLLVGRVGPTRVLTAGLVGLAVSSSALLVLVVAGIGGLVSVAVCTFLVLTSIGFIAPNATALALNDFPQSAGSAAALLGLMQFAIGAGIAPLVGLAGANSVTPMAAGMASCGVAALGVRLLLGRQRNPALVPASADLASASASQAR